MKVVIDTNVFISSFFGEIPKKIAGLWKESKITLCLSQAIIEEYIDVLTRLGISAENINKLLFLFAQGHSCLYARTAPKLKVVNKDPDDDKFFECALKHGAKDIISGDKAVLAIKKYLQIEVLSPKKFLDVFEKIYFDSN